MQDDGSLDVENLKIVLLGDIAVGKTSLSHRFVTDDFLVNSESTVRIAFQSKNITFQDESNNEQNVNLRIWDTAGQEKYRSLAPLYIRGADVAIIVYDVTMKDSLDTVTYWRNELKESGEDLVIAVVGNKVDVVKEREISTESGRVLAESLGALFEETSAVTGANVESIFFKAAKLGWEKKQQKEVKRMAGVSLNDDGAGESKCAC